MCKKIQTFFFAIFLLPGGHSAAKCCIEYSSQLTFVFSRPISDFSGIGVFVSIRLQISSVLRLYSFCRVSQHLLLASAPPCSPHLLSSPPLISSPPLLPSYSRGVSGPGPGARQTRGRRPCPPPSQLMFAPPVPMWEEGPNRELPR